MRALRNYGWLVPTLVAIGVAAVTDINPWALGAIAAAVIFIGYAVAWFIRSQSGSPRDGSPAHHR
ncbi:hypothetical protein [Clavibacter sp. VKM Ac-2872]|uniref:hypothetical protein n=1 Tax=Clavibacter sp. VKM Ac-2872 TaxID=2783812 RepID=UPI00188A676B|nr:hypothetical protein [Clavibacter sp. VKM Ac-2872]MBF4622934.1 hypothetical protein [Clavibacter sp. VKM Ac-2872]